MSQVIKLILRMVLKLLIVATVSCWGVSQMTGIGWVQIAGNRSAIAMAGPSGYSVEFFATTAATRAGLILPPRASIAVWTDFPPANRIEHVSFLGIHLWIARNSDFKVAIAYSTTLVLLILLTYFARRKR